MGTGIGNGNFEKREGNSHDNSLPADLYLVHLGELNLMMDLNGHQ
jgi:hypothetical protein